MLGRAQHIKRLSPAAWWVSLGLLWLACAPAGPAWSAAPAQLPAVRLDGNYFSRDGHRFLVVGAHWVPAKAAMQWPLQWDPQDIEADFAQMERMGFNTVRLDLMWAWFEPRPGNYNPQAFDQFDQLIASGAQAPHLSAPHAVCRRRGRGGLLGRAVALGPQSAGRSGDVAARDQPCAGIWAPLRARNGHPGLGSDRRAAVLDRARTPATPWPSTGRG